MRLRDSTSFSSALSLGAFRRCVSLAGGPHHWTSAAITCGSASVVYRPRQACRQQLATCALRASRFGGLTRQFHSQIPNALPRCPLGLNDSPANLLFTARVLMTCCHWPARRPRCQWARCRVPWQEGTWHDFVTGSGRGTRPAVTRLHSTKPEGHRALHFDQESRLVSRLGFADVLSALLSASSR